MDKKKYPLINAEDSLSGVASTGDMTGLQPTPPITESDAESYTTLGSVPVPDSVLRDNDNKKD